MASACKAPITPAVPAAAVTALRKLGLPAEEGEIAILARTEVPPLAHRRTFWRKCCKNVTGWQFWIDLHFSRIQKFG